MRMYLKIENNVIVDVKFLTLAAVPPLPPAAYVATDPHRRKTIDEALKLTNKAVVEVEGSAWPRWYHCPGRAGREGCLFDYYRRQHRSWNHCG